MNLTRCTWICIRKKLLLLWLCFSNNLFNWIRNSFADFFSTFTWIFIDLNMCWTLNETSKTCYYYSFKSNLLRRAIRSVIFLAFSRLTLDCVSVWTTDFTWTLSAWTECTLAEPVDDDAVLALMLDIMNEFEGVDARKNISEEM